MKYLFLILNLIVVLPIFTLEDDHKEGYHSLDDVPLVDEMKSKSCVSYSLEDIFKGIYIEVYNHREHIRNLIDKENTNLTELQLNKSIELERRIITIEIVKNFFINHQFRDINDYAILNNENFLKNMYIRYEEQEYGACCCSYYTISAPQVIGKFKNIFPKDFVVKKPLALSISTLFHIKVFNALNAFNNNKSIPSVNVVNICRDVMQKLNKEHPMLYNKELLTQVAKNKLREYELTLSQGNYCSIQ